MPALNVSGELMWLGAMGCAQFFLEAFQWYGGAISGSRDRTFCSSGGNLGNGAHPYGHVHRAGGIHHAKHRRLDHVRQIPELTGQVDINAISDYNGMQTEAPT
jgi:hypothetical protein